MSNDAFNFLTDSFLWSDAKQATGFTECGEEELRSELVSYRHHVLSSPVAPAAGLSVSVSARQRLTTPIAVVKQSVLYLDEVLLPDPVFEVTESTRDRPLDLWPAEGIRRAQLARAAKHMKALTPLVRLGLVRFVPFSYILETPDEIPFTRSDDAFASRVPAELRSWFYDRVHLQKVVVESNQRIVLGAPPDFDTRTIQVDFGQLGRVSGYEFRTAEIRADRTIAMTHEPPDTHESMTAWLRQCVNQAAGDYLGAVIASTNLASKMGCSFLTHCSVTADLLEHLHSTGARDKSHEAALSLDLPMVAGASVEEIAELVEAEPGAFQAFRCELRRQLETLATIADPAERTAEAKKAQTALSREQVEEVERKVAEAHRARKWKVPVITAKLAIGALGIGTGASLPWFVAGGALALQARHVERESHFLPGYFLWKLSQT